ncbi:MAG: AbrB/MazE/SpoVT family DNA-binding domain-containing protein [Anaerolineales bacterium]|nr:AbrB/MazE/SpoVT family DNA-binding domain-containing protein [Anaerolineales bacterium]
MTESKEYIATVTSKGQVTIPAAVREQLGISAQDRVIFRMGKDRSVMIEPLPMTLEEAFGSVAPLNRPENFDEIQRIAREERELKWLDKLSR